jgi:hypothetical protein
MRSERELLVDCLERLNRVGIPYLLTGSMAANYWGIPRTTHDLDFVVALEFDSTAALVAAFEGDYYIQSESVQAALKPPHQFNALDTQSALKVDFWVLRDDPFERQAFERRAHVTIFGTPAWMATAEDVILHKLFWNTITPSERQLQDAAGVFAVQSDALDASYLKRWAATLGVEVALDDLVAGRITPKST